MLDFCLEVAGGGGTAGAGAAAAAAGGTGVPPGAGADPGAGGGQPWYGGFSDDLKGLVQLKGWKDPSSVVESYRNLEKLHGDPKQLVKLPSKEDAPEWGDVWNRLGRPEKADGYDPKSFDGMDPEFAKFCREQFHGLGLTKAQGDKLGKSLFDRSQSLVKTQNDAATAKHSQEAAGLKTEWGQAYEQNVGIADRVADAIGLDEKQFAALEGTLGQVGLAKFLHSLNAKLGVGGEDGFEGGKGGGFRGGAMTPESAKVEINNLIKDPGFTKKLLEGDNESRKRWDQLHQWAAPPTT
jgi:hypothetical protein